ncbi:kinase-like protein [Cadophora sp. DSE1049]|nr:kinase-like protein [Cadophora sp. DSE1049]
MERGTYAGRGEWETTSQCGSTEDDHDCAESVPSALPSPSPSTEPAIVTSAEDEEELDSDELNEHDEIEMDNLNLGAVMWGMKSIDECDTTTVYKHFGQPRQFDLGKMWKRGDLVKQITIPEKLREDKIYLGDFGMAIEDGTAVNTKVQRPAMFCAPERFHNVNPSFASDMWSYMWIFAYLYLGFYPINGCGADVLPCMVETLGPLPEQWRGSFKYYDVPGEDGWYDQSRVPVDHATWMSMVARREPAISQEEQQLAVRVLNKLFCYEPTRRLSAAQLLEDPDFLDLMGRYVSIS